MFVKCDRKTPVLEPVFNKIAGFLKRESGTGVLLWIWEIFKNSIFKSSFFCKLKPATLLKVTLLHGCFSRFLNCTNGTKSRKAHIWWSISQKFLEAKKMSTMFTKCLWYMFDRAYNTLWLFPWVSTKWHGVSYYVLQKKQRGASINLKSIFCFFISFLIWLPLIQTKYSELGHAWF